MVDCKNRVRTLSSKINNSIAMEKGVQRWIVDISKWDPSPLDFSSALSVLPLHDHSSITRYAHMDDRKRALVSRLLQYALVHEVLRIQYDKILIYRTSEGKPYMECEEVSSEFPNFNFNVSHHGDYVAIASEPLCLVGLDIVSYTIPHKETIAEYIQNFSSYFSSLEWDSITNAGTSDEILVEFYRYWSLKEAYVKATGSGLAEKLDKVEFNHTKWNNLSMKIDGKAMADWSFWLFELPNRHCVSVARGHPRSAIESYKRTLKQSDFEEEEYQRGLCLPNLNFIFKTVQQLIPVETVICSK